ncbi:MAG: fatty acid cis/trans isomerase, partial [Halioglobus sp.]|nr:fatty acid cis/trans isomerase [Halioglobus sp.]
GIQFKTDNPKREFLDMLRAHIPAAQATRYHIRDPRFDSLQTMQGEPFSYMPQVAFLEVTQDDGTAQYFSILHNNSYTNNTQMFREAERRVPQEDYLTVVRGFIGSYPNVFFQVSDAHLAGFLKAIELMRNEADYTRLVTNYGIRRTDERFWPLSDRLYAQYIETFPREAGLFDLNRYENR